jgi:YVTN family beta-propeller protein
MTSASARFFCLLLVLSLSFSVSASQSAQSPGPLPGMPPVEDPNDIYAADHAGMLSPAVRNFPERVYVPNTQSNTVSIIDPTTYRVIATHKVGTQPQHVVPSWDMKTLWVLNDMSNSVTAIDPMTGKLGKTYPVEDPYNMYYTPDGKYAIVVAEAMQRLMFRNPQTMKLVNSLKVDCRGVDHMDFSADGRYLIASCEFQGRLIKVDVESQKVVGFVDIDPKAMPQDVKLSPDGRIFYVADMMSNGIFMINGEKPSIMGFIPTGAGAHGLYVSRDSTVLYISNRGEGSISVLHLATSQVIAKWELPNGGSPDMGGVSSDGRVLWLSGRYHREVYAIDTTDGHLIARIPVGKGPHGLAIFPQPGRYSLGHTGVYR